MQTALKEAVDGLYSAFAPVNRPTAIDTARTASTRVPSSRCWHRDRELDDDLSPYLRTWEAALVTRAGASHLLEYVRYRDAWPGLVDTVVATAESVTDEQLYDVLLEVHFLL